jgi:hypothetical protein
MSDNNPNFVPTVQVFAKSATGAALADVFKLPIGENTISYFVNDARSPYAIGRSGVCRFKITVYDGAPPVVNCPDSYIMNTLNGAVVDGTGDWPALVWEDSDPVLVFGGSGHTTDTVLKKGINYISFNATDTSGNVGTCHFTITVVDNNPPFTRCPNTTDSVYEIGFGNSTYDYVFWIDAQDELDKIDDLHVVLVSFDDTTIDHMKAVTVNLDQGDHLFQYAAYDTSGNFGTCTWMVTVLDVEPPHPIMCPADVTIRSTDFNNPDMVSLTFPTPEQVAAGFPLNPADNYYDNLPGPILVTYVTEDGSMSFTAGTKKVVSLVARDITGNYVSTNSTVVSPREITQGRTDQICQFTVTVVPSYTPGKPEAVLSAIFIRKLASDKYGAYLEIRTAMAWPHRLLDLSRVNDEVEPRTNVEVEADCESGLADPNDPYYTGKTCVQKFGFTVEFPTGCTVSDQVYSFRFETSCPLCDPQQFPGGFFTVDITLNASDFCTKELSDAIVEGSLVTVSEFQLADYASTHVQGDGLAVADQSLFFQGQRVIGLVRLTSPSVSMRSVTLVRIERSMYMDQARSVLDPGVAVNPAVLLSNGATSNVVIGPIKDDYATFSFPVDMIPLDSERYALLEATVSIDYDLGAAASTGRRLLNKVIKIKMDVPQRERATPTLGAASDGAHSGGDARFARELLQTGAPQNGAKSATADFLGINGPVFSSSNAFLFDADGFIAFSLIRVHFPPDYNDNPIRILKIMKRHIEQHLGEPVDVQFARRTAETHALLIVAHRPAKYTAVKNLLERSNSPIHGTLARDADSRITMDRDLYYNAVVDKATLANSGGDNSAGDDDSWKLYAVAALSAVGVCCFLAIVFVIMRRKREAADAKTRAKSDDSVATGRGDMYSRRVRDSPEGTSRASSVASSRASSRMGSRRNSKVHPVDIDALDVEGDFVDVRSVVSMKRPTPTPPPGGGDLYAELALASKSVSRRTSFSGKQGALAPSKGMSSSKHHSFSHGRGAVAKTARSVRRNSSHEVLKVETQVESFGAKPSARPANNGAAAPVRRASLPVANDLVVERFHVESSEDDSPRGVTASGVEKF